MLKVKNNLIELLEETLNTQDLNTVSVKTLVDTLMPTIKTADEARKYREDFKRITGEISVQLHTFEYRCEEMIAKVKEDFNKTIPVITNPKIEWIASMNLNGKKGIAYLEPTLGTASILEDIADHKIGFEGYHGSKNIEHDCSLIVNDSEVCVKIHLKDLCKVKGKVTLEEGLKDLLESLDNIKHFFKQC